MPEFPEPEGSPLKVTLNRDTVVDGLDHDECRRYLEFLLWHYKVVDAFWFLYAAEGFGQQEAEKLNERVWAKAGGLGAMSIMETFGTGAVGLEGFLELLRLYPWTLLIGYEIELRGDEMFLTVPRCPSQQARLKRGLGEYVCKAMHRAEFESLARVVDPRIRVECLYAPPDPHPTECFCKWRFWIAEPQKKGTKTCGET